MKILVTGSGGLIGMHFCEMILRQTDHTLVGMTRTANARTIARFSRLLKIDQELNPNGARRLQARFGDLLEDISGVCEGVDWVVNFAAKTFVDHSIRDPEPFVQSNVVGTIRLLEEARRQKVKRFIQVSTDEVYGSILEGAYGEAAPINPSNVYAASKAGADALAIAYAHTFGLHTIITRTENNYSTHQHPQKVIPAFVKALLAGKPVPVYGDGLHVRQWLHVTDHCAAIRMLLETDQAPPGSVWHVAGNQELTNIELARRIIDAFPLDGPVEDFIRYVPDHDIRPGHDRRYALSTEKIAALGWKPAVSLDKGIPETVKWYRSNPDWLTP